LKELTKKSLESLIVDLRVWIEKFKLDVDEATLSGTGMMWVSGTGVG